MITRPLITLPIAGVDHLDYVGDLSLCLRVPIYLPPSTVPLCSSVTSVSDDRHSITLVQEKEVRIKKSVSDDQQKINQTPTILFDRSCPRPTELLSIAGSQSQQQSR